MIQVPNDANATFAKSITRDLTDAGYQALWAGGCVRDFLLGTQPKDYDIATNATPDQVRELFGHDRTLAIGASFGVIVVLPPNKKTAQIEVATFRTDGGYSDGRRPDSVAFSTAENDAARRDFTINGMFFDPLSEQVIDYVGGQEDLERRVIRAIGTPEERIREDKLRMLRAIRFATRLGFSIQAETEGAIARSSAELSAVSGERIAEELRKLLSSPNAHWGTEQLVETGLMQEIIPLFSLRWDAGGELARPLVSQPNATWLQRFCGLAFHLCHVHSAELQMLLALLRERLKWSNEELAATQFILECQQTFESASQLPWSELQPWLVSQYAAAGIEFLRLRSLANAKTDCLATQARYLQQKMSLPADELDPPSLLTGNDLKEAGLRPSPEFRRLLQKIRSLQLDGELSSKAEALEWIRTDQNESTKEQSN